MSLFKNTSNEEAKQLLGTRFDTYLAENGDVELHDGLFVSASERFRRDNKITQFIKDVGHSFHSAFNPNIVTLYLLEKDGEERCHNNWYKPARMNVSLGDEYLYILVAYGLSLFNPSTQLTYEQNMNGLRMALHCPIEMFERNHSNGLDAFFGVKDSPLASSFKALESTFRDSVIYAYLKSMLMSNDAGSRSQFFSAQATEEFVRPLGIIEGDFSVETLRDSEQALRTLCANGDDSTSKPRETTFALALTILPGQALILKGEDPQEVFEVIQSRAAIALTTKQSNTSDVELEATAIAKQVFLPFPKLWSEMGIDPNEYLGLPFDQLDAEKRNTNRTQQVGTLFMADTPMNPGKALSVISFNNECFGYTFGEDYFLRPAAKPEAFLNRQLSCEQFSRLVDVLIGYDGVVYSPFIEDPENLAKTDSHRLSELVVKAALKPDSDTADLLRWISKSNSKAVDIAFEALLDSEQPLNTIEVLLEHRTPPAEIIKRLPRHLRGKTLESGLGL